VVQSVTRTKLIMTGQLKENKTKSINQFD